MIDNQVKKLFLTLCLCVFLPGCSSSISTRYYKLSEIPVQPVNKNKQGADTPAIVLGPLYLPEYLNRTQIVLRKSDTELELVTGSRWAEPLQDSFVRLLVTSMNARLGKTRAFAFTHRQPEPARYRITLDVTRFDGSNKGEARLSVQWILREQDSGIVIDQGTNDYTVRFNPGSPGYGEYVVALSGLVSELANDLSQMVNALE